MWSVHPVARTPSIQPPPSLSSPQAVVTVLQARTVREVRVKLHSPTRLVPVHIDGAPPSYFIVGGLVFTPVTVPLLRSEYGREYDYDAPVKLLDHMMHGMAERADQQVVVLSQVLAAAVNVGYEDTVNTQVLRVNGTPVHNLAHLVALIQDCSDAYLRVDLEYSQLVVLETAAARQATPHILQQHGVAADRSPDLAHPVGNGGQRASAKAPKRRAR